MLNKVKSLVFEKGEFDGTNYVVYFDESFFNIINGWDLVGAYYNNKKDELVFSIMDKDDRIDFFSWDNLTKAEQEKVYNYIVNY